MITVCSVLQADSCVFMCSAVHLSLMCNAEHISAVEKLGYLNCNDIFYASVIKMSVTDANVLKRNQQKLYSKVFAAKFSRLKREGTVCLYELENCCVWMPALAADTHQALSSAWHCLPASLQCLPEWRKERSRCCELCISGFQGSLERTKMSPLTH